MKLNNRSRAALQRQVAKEERDKFRQLERESNLWLLCSYFGKPLGILFLVVILLWMFS